MKLRSYDSFDSLPPAYDQLFKTAGDECLFFSRTWFELLAETILQPDQAPLIYALEENAVPLVALVGFSDNGRKANRRPCTLSSLSNFYSMRFAPLWSATVSDRATVLRNLFDAIRTDDRKWDKIALRPLDQSAPAFRDLLAAMHASGWIVHPYFLSGNWFEVTKDRAFDEYKKKLPSGTRRLERKFRESPSIRFELVTGKAGLESAISAYEKVYAASWKDAEQYPNFFPEMLRRCTKLGTVRLGILYVEDVPAAAQIWLVSGKRATIYKVAYDESYKKLSVGSILNLLMMRHVMDVDEVEEVDFGSGDDKYKTIWMSHRRENWGIVAYNRSTLWGLAEGLGQIGKTWLKRLKRRSNTA